MDYTKNYPSQKAKWTNPRSCWSQRVFPTRLCASRQEENGLLKIQGNEYFFFQGNTVINKKALDSARGLLPYFGLYCAEGKSFAGFAQKKGERGLCKETSKERFPQLLSTSQNPHYWRKIHFAVGTEI